MAAGLWHGCNPPSARQSRHPWSQPLNTTMRGMVRSSSRRGRRLSANYNRPNGSGDVGIHFHTLQMPDGTTEKIDALSMSLSYGPLKGSVSGSNKAKRILVRSLAGVGTMVAFLVGGPSGFGGVSGQLNNSILLRERIASNAGLAGEQEMASLASNENIVVSYTHLRAH